jgi:hypothetical protein
VKACTRHYHDEETTDKCWKMKSAVIESILDANGTNDYDLPYGYDECKPTVQDINDSSRDDDEPLARTSSYEDAQGVLPCPQAHSPTNRGPR